MSDYADQLARVVADYRRLEVAWNRFVEAAPAAAAGTASPSSGEPQVALDNLPPPRMLVCGNVNAGKSTFINAVLGQECLPTSTAPRITIIRAHSSDDGTLWKVRPLDGRGEVLVCADADAALRALERLEAAADDKVTRQGDHLKVVALDVPRGISAMLDSGLELVNSPGMNDGEAVREKVRELMTQSTIVLYLMTPDHGVVVTAGLAAELAAAGVLPIFVVTKVDAKPFVQASARREQARTRHTQGMGRIVGRLFAAFCDMFPHVAAAGPLDANDFYLPLSAEDAKDAAKYGDPVPPAFQRMLGSIASVAARRLREAACKTVDRAVMDSIGFLNTYGRTKAQLQLARPPIAACIRSLGSHWEHLREILTTSVEAAFDEATMAPPTLREEMHVRGAPDVIISRRPPRSVETTAAALFHSRCSVTLPTADVTTSGLTAQQQEMHHVASRLQQSVYAAAWVDIASTLARLGVDVESGLKDELSAVGVPMWSAATHVMREPCPPTVVTVGITPYRDWCMLRRLMANVMGPRFDRVQLRGTPLDADSREEIAAVVAEQMRSQKQDWVAIVVEGACKQLDELRRGLEAAQWMVDHRLSPAVLQHDASRIGHLLGHLPCIYIAYQRLMLDGGPVSVDDTMVVGGARYAQVQVDTCRRPDVPEHLQLGHAAAAAGVVVGRAEHEVLVLLKEVIDRTPEYDASETGEGRPDYALKNCVATVGAATTEAELAAAEHFLQSAVYAPEEESVLSPGSTFRCEAVARQPGRRIAITQQDQPSDATFFSSCQLSPRCAPPLE